MYDDVPPHFSFVVRDILNNICHNFIVDAWVEDDSFFGFHTHLI
jgi:hypothetical protein